MRRDEYNFVLENNEKQTLLINPFIYIIFTYFINYR